MGCVIPYVYDTHTVDRTGGTPYTLWTPHMRVHTNNKIIFRCIIYIKCQCNAYRTNQWYMSLYGDERVILGVAPALYGDYGTDLSNVFTGVCEGASD